MHNSSQLNVSDYQANTYIRLEKMCHNVSGDVHPRSDYLGAQSLTFHPNQSQ